MEAKPKTRGRWTVSAASHDRTDPQGRCQVNRNLAIFAGVVGGVIAGYFIARSRAVANPAAQSVIADLEGPKSFKMADVAEKCRNMNFREDKASAAQKLADGVVVRIIPAAQSSKYKLSQLARGRIIAKVRNEESGDWPRMALYGKDEACWYIWADDDGRIQSKFVRLSGTGEAPDYGFDIQFHQNNHADDAAEWNKKFGAMMDTGMSPFRLAGFSVQDSTFETGNTGWTTCLLNGCCRSRQ